MAVNYKSFADRGVYVGFYGRAVELVRARIPKDPNITDYEALIPNWGGWDLSRATNDLVMPFKDIANWTELIGRDKLLYDRVRENHKKRRGHMDPILMRELRLQVDLEAGDNHDKKLAEHELRIARQDVQNSFLEILAMFGRRYAAITEHEELQSVNRSILMTLSEADPETMIRLVRIIVGTVVRNTSISREQLQERLDTLSDFASPICSLVTNDTSRSVGFLSRQMALLEQLHDEISDYCAQGGPEEIHEAGQVIEANLVSFMQYTMQRAENIKAAVLNEGFYLNDKRYAKLVDLIKDERIKISFALDGWAGHATRWLSVDEDDISARNAVIAYILRQMPSPPRELEDEVEVQYGSDNLMSMRGRVVKEMHSWMDDSLDQDIYRRVKKSRRDLVESGQQDKVEKSQAAVNKLVKRAVTSG